MDDTMNIQSKKTKGGFSFKQVLIGLLVAALLIVGILWWKNGKGVGTSISLDSIPVKISIPGNTKVLRLKRGDYVFTLNKKENIKSKKYLVTLTDTFGKWQKDKNDPIDAYSASYELVPYDEKYSKALEMTKALHKNGGSFEMPVSDPEEGQKLTEMMNNLEKQKINVAILPADSDVKETSRKVKINDVITLTGICFDHEKEELNNVKQEMSKCMQSVDLIYATYLSISE